MAIVNRSSENNSETNSKILSEQFTGVESNGKWGVVNKENKRIINFQYDDVSCIQDKIVVAKDGCVGILDGNGSIIINPSYLSIECATINDNEYLDFYDVVRKGKYNKHYYFDSNTDNPLFEKTIITYNACYKDLGHNKGIDINTRKPFDFTKYFILKSRDYSEIFSLDNGVLADSKYEDIRLLTNLSFAMKKDGKWGVYRADYAKLIIECEYDRIIFEGNHVVLLCKNDLWGAKSLVLSDSFIGKVLYNVNIPLKFKDIKILDSNECYFSVKSLCKSFKDELFDNYSIVDRKGNEIDNMHAFYGLLDGHCELFNNNFNRILTSRKSKYGFISSQGYITIPFQYDEISIRKDGLFNVRINESWGIIDILGKEIVSIKYCDPIPDKLDNTIVQNSYTGRYGMLSKNGSEKIPSIYEHLFVENDLIYFGYNGHNYRNGGNFFSNIDDVIWGVMNNNGEVIIDPKYDCYKIQDGFILAGRDGHMLHHDGTSYGSDYSGDYDLYTPNGELIFGGFKEFIYDTLNEIYVFFLGGNWRYHTSYYDEWNNITIRDYIFNRGIGLWLFLDKDFKSIIKNKEGNSFTYKKGTTCNIEVKEERNKKTFVYNIPTGSMSKGFIEIVDNAIIIADSNNEKTRKYAALSISTGNQTPFYKSIKQIDNSIFFFSDNGKIGIRDYDSILLTANNLCITNPVNGYVFAVKEIDKEHCCVQLLSVYDKSIKHIAINKIKTVDLIDKIPYGGLKIQFVDNDQKLDSLMVSDRSIYDKSFLDIIEVKESKYECMGFSDIYWFSDDFRLDEESFRLHGKSDNDDDRYDSDYERDTWDALTDGQYGDMPDDFDGDYSFLGY